MSFVTDLTSIHGADSLFRSDVKFDPWGKQLLGNLANLFIYEDEIKYILPVRDSTVDPNSVVIPTLLQNLRDSGEIRITPVVYDLSNQPYLDNEKVEEFVLHFTDWSSKNKHYVKNWVRLHGSKYIQDQHIMRINRGYVFDAHKILSDHKKLIDGAVEKIGINYMQFIYSFDLVLRYPLYGALMGANEIYLNHPIRDAYSPSHLSHRSISTVDFPVSFRKWASSQVNRATLDKFVKDLLMLREEVHKHSLTDIGRHLTDEETRDFLLQTKIPGSLRKSVLDSVNIAVTTGLAVTADLVAGVGASAIVAVAASAVFSQWSGNMPGSANKIEWLKWAIEWPLITKN